MIKQTFIMHHLGLGDHILCNGLTRQVIQRDNIEKLFYPVKVHNIKNIKRMYSDIRDKIFLIPVDNDEEMIQVSKKFEDSNTIKLGIFSDKKQDSFHDFSHVFYQNCQINFTERWDSFYFDKKTLSKETENTLEYKQQKTFVHEDTSRNLKIDNKYLINKDIYRPNHTLGVNNNLTLFDYYDILTKVEKIHCIDSSFACFIDHLPELRDKPKFIHRYARPEGGPEYRNNWQIIYER